MGVPIASVLALVADVLSAYAGSSSEDQKKRALFSIDETYGRLPGVQRHVRWARQAPGHSASQHLIQSKEPIGQSLSHSVTQWVRPLSSY